MTGFLFFAGSLLRWSAQKPKEFLLLHGYILIIYGVTSLLNSYSFRGAGLILTAGAFAPLFLGISRGLPLDCLNYKSAAARELSESPFNK